MEDRSVKSKNIDPWPDYLTFVTYVSGLSVRIFVALYLGVFVALCVPISVEGANKVEDTMSWCVGTNEILASNMTFTRLKVNKGTLRPPSWFFTIFFFFYYG